MLSAAKPYPQQVSSGALKNSRFSATLMHTWTLQTAERITILMMDLPPPRVYKAAAVLQFTLSAAFDSSLLCL